MYWVFSTNSNGKNAPLFTKIQICSSIVNALSTTFFPRRWTAEERNNGFVNYIMGLCFISEGAIPYAAGDPLRVIPSCIVGSAIAGGLSMLFNCTLMAPPRRCVRIPHGGQSLPVPCGAADRLRRWRAAPDSAEKEQALISDQAQNHRFTPNRWFCLCARRAHQKRQGRRCTSRWPCHFRMI